MHHPSLFPNPYHQCDSTSVGKFSLPYLKHMVTVAHRVHLLLHTHGCSSPVRIYNTFRVRSTTFEKHRRRRCYGNAHLLTEVWYHIVICVYFVAFSYTTKWLQFRAVHRRLKKDISLSQSHLRFLLTNGMYVILKPA